MHAMAQLMRQGHHIAGFALVVQQQIGVRAGHGGVGESAGRFAGAHGHVDPVFGEEFAADGGQLRREGVVGILHQRNGIRPGDGTVASRRQRGVAVPIIQGFLAELLGLPGVIFVGEVFVVFLHGGDERIDHFIFHLVAHVAAGDGAFEAALVVLDLLGFGQGVGDEAVGGAVGFEHAGDFPGGCLAFFRVGVREQVKRFGGGHFLAVDGEFEAADGFVIKPLPGAIDNRIGVDIFLQLVAELVVFIDAHRFDPRSVMG